MFTIHVIDNGLFKLAGHHYHHALGMISGAKELGVRVKIYSMAADSLPKEIKNIANPFFRKFLYRPNPHQNIDAHANLLAGEILGLIANFQKHDILLLPNANYDEIAALPKLLEASKYKGRIILRLMFYPHGDSNKYLSLLHQVMEFKNIDIVVSSQPYSRWLSENEVPNRFVPGLPHHLPYELVDKIQENYDFAYLGQPAAVKGFEHFLNALLILARNNFRPKALIHAQGINLPEQINRELPHCNFIRNEISDEQFYSDLISSRSIVTFYDVNNYRFSDSGIVTESIAFNKSIISSPLPFIAPTFGNEFAAISTVNEWNAISLANKMMNTLNGIQESDIKFRASLTAKILCSPTIFIKNLLDI